MTTYDYNTYQPPRPANPQAPKFQRGQPSYADYNTMAPQPSYPTFGQQQAPSYQSFNDPTLAAGAMSSGSPGAALPPGAIPISPYSGGGNGNANQMVSKGFKKKLINGGWYWVPPDEQSQTPQYSLY